MQRMTDVLSRMLNDPATRAALSGGGEDSLEGVMEQHVENNQNSTEGSSEVNVERGGNESERVEHEIIQDNNENETENPPGQESLVDRERDVTIEPVETQTPLEAKATTSENSSDRVNNLGEESAKRDESTASSSAESTGNRVSFNETVPMETESNHADEQCCLQSFITNKRRMSQLSTLSEHSADVGTSHEGSIMENLQDRLTTMRDGFLER